MTTPDEFDPDDNFDQTFGHESDVDEEAAQDAVVWQLLLLINPGDEDAALQQFAAYREAAADAGEDADPVWLLRDAIDWKAGFFVAEDDPQALVESLDELAARWNLRIDWGMDDDEFDLDQVEVPTLINTAYDRLREHHYTAVDLGNRQRTPCRLDHPATRRRGAAAGGRSAGLPRPNRRGLVPPWPSRGRAGQ